MDINALDFNGATAFCLAVQAKHTALALQILAEDHVNINVAGQNGRIVLYYAARTGNIAIISALLDKGDQDPNVYDDDG